MATPRKHWFKVADSVLREEWSNDTLATHVRLMAWLNQRWARDGIEHEKAGSAVIGGFDAMAITGVKRSHVALQRLASHPLVAGLTSARAALVGVCQSSGALLENTQSPTAVLLEWSKFSEFQEYGSRSPGSSCPVAAPSGTKPRKKENELPTPSAPAGSSRLLNLLSKERGERDEKSAWLEHELPLIEAEAEAGNGTLKTLVIRYYRQYAKGDRRFKGAAIVAAHHTKRAVETARAPPAAAAPPEDRTAYESSPTLRSLFAND